MKAGADRGRIPIRGLIGILAITLLLVGAGMALRRGFGAAVAPSGRTDPVIVVSASPAPAQMSVVTAGAEPAAADAARSLTMDQRMPILQALHLPPDTPLDVITTNDPARHVVCGDVAIPSTGAAHHFVYLGMAGLAAIDDGSADFQQMRERLCLQ